MGEDWHPSSIDAQGIDLSPVIGVLTHFSPSDRAAAIEAILAVCARSSSAMHGLEPDGGWLSSEHEGMFLVTSLRFTSEISILHVQKDPDHLLPEAGAHLIQRNGKNRFIKAFGPGIDPARQTCAVATSALRPPVPIDGGHRMSAYRHIVSVLAIELLACLSRSHPRKPTDKCAAGRGAQDPALVGALLAVSNADDDEPNPLVRGRWSDGSFEAELHCSMALADARRHIDSASLHRCAPLSDAARAAFCSSTDRSAAPIGQHCVGTPSLLGRTKATMLLVCAAELPDPVRIPGRLGSRVWHDVLGERSKTQCLSGYVKTSATAAISGREASSG